ncbi:CaiC Acyl-CoA synthetase AMP-forming AMP-acid ligase II [Pyrenophora tritici-repentis]|uniref:AMP-binding enzyme n=1 Tax=Pyrenophora tritici-repentis TaxID=45151 RepID=A0A2W1F2Q5_9PLEO|nr:CaiC Acyl-CoA synthetase/AMP-acid ligase II [Pyrenophora tritici-repentis]KAF7571944.1 CaiC, Acyl-CoA synthetase (AMP-forming)/AMP-acid ligase II [Pyrenophora tritici-repentis]KAI0585527.1 CaiC Acyl-CoA synthetase (AMP-forming)/AMP-acid ligase II [Pyrenophora tritici-repentis]KAI0592640.1 CaiC Acyl-CoA synthetase (AMP-forming)/AMP-acid ligase II [Pyrenophora tritici-repentis]KAI0615686.1 CaiC Acyl-CoA synthetase (AMP-forming)/AMP-acid ligase II [Pyrenophora tritici-repentis]
MDDRCCTVPKHAGYSVLPNTPLFGRLLRYASRIPARIAVDDVCANLQRTHLDLLSDVLALRHTVLDTLDRAICHALERKDEVYIAIVAAGGYEYTVAILAILALGAAAVPVEGASYFIEKSQAALVLSSSVDMSKCLDLERRVVATSGRSFRAVPIRHSIPASALVIFTSGTTGPPKGAVMQRSYTFNCALEIADYYQLTGDDVLLHVLPVHHVTGVGINFFPFLISGSRIEFRSGGFDEIWTWEQWKQGGLDPRRRLTFFLGVPTIYMRLRRYYQRTLSKLPAGDLAEYIASAKQFRACLCGTSALPRPLDDFWSDLMDKRIFQRYGATEFGAIFRVRLDDRDAPEGMMRMDTSKPMTLREKIGFTTSSLAEHLWISSNREATKFLLWILSENC